MELVNQAFKIPQRPQKDSLEDFGETSAGDSRQEVPQNWTFVTL